MRRSGAVRRAGTRGGGSPIIWDPSQDSTLVARWKADTGTTIATGISDWTTKNPAGTYTASQAVGATQPTLTTSDASFGNKSTANSNASQYLQGSIAAGAFKTALTGSAAHAIWFVLKMHASSSDVTQYWLFTISDGTSNERTLIRRNTSGKLEYIRNQAGVNVNNASTAVQVAATGAKSWCLSSDGTNVTWYLSEALDTAAALNGRQPAAPTQLNIFSSQAGGTPFYGGLAEICFFNAAMSATLLANLATYRAREYGI